MLTVWWFPLGQFSLKIYYIIFNSQKNHSKKIIFKDCCFGSVAILLNKVSCSQRLTFGTKSTRLSVSKSVAVSNWFFQNSVLISLFQTDPHLKPSGPHHSESLFHSNPKAKNTHLPQHAPPPNNPLPPPMPPPMAGDPLLHLWRISSGTSDKLLPTCILFSTNWGCDAKMKIFAHFSMVKFFLCFNLHVTYL